MYRSATAPKPSDASDAGVGTDTVSDTTVVAEVTPVPLAVIVMGVVPAGTTLDTVNVTVLVVTLDDNVPGSNDTTTPFGAPVAANVTGPAKPPPRVIVTCKVVVAERREVAELVVVARPTVGVGAGVGASPDPPQASKAPNSANERKRFGIEVL